MRARFGPTPWIALGAFIVAGAHSGLQAGLVFGVLVPGAYWWGHSWLQPMITCRSKKCQGGRIPSRAWPRRYHNHAGCEGRGRYPRWGHRVFHGMGVFRRSAEQTGPGWGRVRRRSR